MISMLKKKWCFRCLAIFIISSVIGCSDDDQISSFHALKDRLDSDYYIISAISSEPVDVNMDGSRSRDLLLENPEIARAFIELNIFEDSNIFLEHWPIEYIGVPAGEELDSTQYKSHYSLNYARYAIASYFDFDAETNHITLIDPEPVIDYTGKVDTRFVFPESIKMVTDDVVEAISIRNLYTKDGYVTVEITANYQRL